MVSFVNVSQFRLDFQTDPLTGVHIAISFWQSAGAGAGPGNTW